MFYKISNFFYLDQTSEIMNLITEGVNLNFLYDDGDYAVNLAVKKGKTCCVNHF